MDIKLYTEEFEVISSGSVIIPSEDVVIFSFNNKLRIKIIFQMNNTNPTEGRYYSSLESDSEGQILNLHIENMNHSFFSATDSGINIGKIDGKLLALRFSIVSINQEKANEDKLFFYTWYLSKNAEANGK